MDHAAKAMTQDVDDTVMTLTRELVRRNGPHAIVEGHGVVLDALVNELSRAVGGNYLTVYALKCLLREMREAMRDGSVRSANDMRSDDKRSHIEVREKNGRSWTEDL